MRTPQQARSSASTDAMLDAVEGLLAEGGLPAVTVAAVARRSGVSNGSLYHRFGDRSGLLAAAADRSMTRIEADTRAAFARADEEPDDHRAVAQLAHDALDIFGRHHVAMRTFLVGLRDVPAVRERTVRSSHLLAETVAGWLVRRTGTSRARAEAAYRLLFSIGAGEALFTEEQVSAAPLDRADLEAAVTRALLAVVGE